MKIINNHEIRLFDELKPILTKGVDVFICSSYFTFNALFELESELNFFAETKGKSRSEIIIESILEYIQNHSTEKTPYELGKDLFGKYSSNHNDLSQNRKKYLK